MFIPGKWNHLISQPFQTYDQNKFSFLIVKHSKNLVKSPECVTGHLTDNGKSFLPKIQAKLKDINSNLDVAWAEDPTTEVGKINTLHQRGYITSQKKLEIWDNAPTIIGKGGFQRVEDNWSITALQLHGRGFVEIAAWKIHILNSYMYLLSIRKCNVQPKWQENTLWSMCIWNFPYRMHLVQWMQRVMIVFTSGPTFLSSTALWRENKIKYSLRLQTPAGNNTCVTWLNMHVMNTLLQSLRLKGLTNVLHQNSYCTSFLKICCLQICFCHCQKPSTDPEGRTLHPDHIWDSPVDDSPTKTPSHPPWWQIKNIHVHVKVR